VRARAPATDPPFMGPSRRARPASLAALVAIAAAGLLAHFLTALIVGHDTLVTRVLFVGDLAVATAACLARGALVRRDRAVWLLVGAALLAFSFGDAYWEIELAGRSSPPYPSLADLGYLAFYPTMAAAFVVGLHSREHRLRAAVALDVTAGALIAAAVGASLLYPALRAATGGSPATVATNLSYPVADVVLIVLATARLTMSRGSRSAGWLVLLAGMVAFVAADVVYLDQTARDTYQDGTVLDSLWLLGGVIWASATLLGRSSATLAEVRQPRAIEAWPVLFMLAATALLTYDHFERTNGLSLWLSVGTLGVAVVRMALTLADNRRLLAARERDLLTDELTGLANRRGLAAAVARQLAIVRRSGSSAAILMLDLDNFKYVNDALGHRVGDQVIAAVGRALCEELRDGDVAARLGGDEFAAVLHDTDLEGAAACAQRLCDLIRNSQLCPGVRPGQITVSVGVAPLAPTEDSWDRALANADAAMYAAKENGRDGYAVHNGNLLPAAVLTQRYHWSTRLRTALSDDGFELYAQPIVDLATGATCAHELLLRLVDEGRLWPPGAFLPEAERFGLMPEIDRWVIEHAIELARHAPTPLTVNISAASIDDAHSRGLIIRRLKAAGLPAGRLIFEVTESAAVANVDAARAFAHRLNDLGSPLALDDFGVAFGSFQSLKQLPFDYVKIDGSFIRDLTKNDTDPVFVEAIARAARRLGKRTIAEQVSSHAAVSLLRDLGVDMAQAYLLGRPGPAEEVLAPYKPAEDRAYRPDDRALQPLVA
jgi:diguanylate cyclase (GGDEF)-like protein